MGQDRGQLAVPGMADDVFGIGQIDRARQDEVKRGALQGKLLRRLIGYRIEHRHLAAARNDKPAIIVILKPGAAWPAQVELAGGDSAIGRDLREGRLGGAQPPDIVGQA